MRRVFLLSMLALGAASMPAMATPRAIAVQVWKDPTAAAADWIAHGAERLPRKRS